MAGTTLCLLPPTTFDFNDLTLHASNPQAIVIAQRIEVSGWESAILGVRVHSTGTISAGDRIEVAAYVHGYSIDEPGTDFSGTTGQQVGLLQNVVTNTSAVPDYRVVGLDQQFGALVKVVLLAYRTTANPPTAFTVKLSMDLDLKTGVVAEKRMTV